jgi:hypothetical protein
MRRYFNLLLIAILTAFSLSAHSQVLVQSSNGQMVAKTSLVAAIASSDATGKTIHVTTPVTLTGNINLTGVTLHFEPGAYINRGSYTVTGMKEAKPEWFGAVGNGSTDDAAAINSAISAVTTLKGVVTFGTATYRVNSQISVPSSVTLKGQGINSSAIYGPSLSTSILAMAGTNSRAVDLQVIGNAGGSDCITVTSNNISLDRVWANTCGRDGIRIGTDAGTNANSWGLLDVKASACTRRGVYIHDGSYNANAGTATRLQVLQNGEDGLRIERAGFNAFTGILAESNTGRGINISPPVDLNGYNTFLGGDSEANTAGDFLYGSHARYNLISGMQIVSGITDNGANNMQAGGAIGVPGSWTPVITGETSAGTGTYTSQVGTYTKIGSRVDFNIEVTWTAHSGTGQMDISLPYPVDNAQTYTVFQAVPVGITIPTNSTMVALGYTGVSRLRLWTWLTGTPTALSVPASGTVWVSGSYITR